MKNEKHSFMIERWKRKSATYGRYDGRTDVIEAEIFRTMKEAGIDFAGRSVLDIGCGTGKYTIRAAKEAQCVTALDISKEMLDILAEDAGKEGCENIDIVKCPWDEYVADGRKWDIVMATMTPAVRTFEDYERAFACAKESMIYLGWGGRRDVELLADIVSRHKAQAKIFDNSRNMKKWLEGKGIEYFSKVFDEERTKTLSLEGAMDYCADELEAYGVDADSAEIAEAVRKFEDADGSVSFKINGRFELIVFKNCP